ncbi:protein PALE CRESS, chloroplastic-like isoform X1 [Capsicum annuum]|uniref:protein PALE CRESS, chloroplastic-like isoform X1 n=1 Tax=Capsicum annuum TaxID=4072 RepID=UPI001FB18629|nr:protein PALE CRESS, chloroplastic-like isoform X1 [Capsicum annuum]XP_047255059.1 protein PALE CRESS, chloroplastic-like isoform X1 [Capsicum annuum]
MSLSFSCANQEDQIEMAKDVVSFLTQAAEPEMEERKLDEKDVFQSLDLLYRRVEIDILKREAIPAMRLLNDLLNMHDGGLDNEGWPKACKNCIVETFPREDLN